MLPPRGHLTIVDGTCWVFIAFDVGRAIDLEAAAARLASAQRDAIPSQRGGAPRGGPPAPAPSYLQFHPAPLRVTGTMAPTAIGPSRTEPEVECTLFDFGAISVAYRLAISGSLESLHPLSLALDQHAGLRTDAKERVERLIAELGPAVARVGLADITEDYIVFHARKWSEGEGPGRSAEQALPPSWQGDPDQARAAAALLRAGPPDLSSQETADALAATIAYSAGDVCAIDWNAALIFDDRADDTLAVLEFANVELLELRYLDDRLDEILDRAYQRAQGRRGVRAWLLGLADEERRRLAGLQIDAAMLFEGVNNALKLVGDQYLARVYRLTAQRFHLAEWDASITRKLDALQAIYQKLVDDAAARRMEVLEWIVIILIAVSIVLPFVTPGAGK